MRSGMEWTPKHKTTTCIWVNLLQLKEVVKERDYQLLKSTFIFSLISKWNSCTILGFYVMSPVSIDNINKRSVACFIIWLAFFICCTDIGYLCGQDSTVLMTTRCVLQEKIPRKPYNTSKSFIVQAWSITTARYCTHSFLKQKPHSRSISHIHV